MVPPAVAVDGGSGDPGTSRPGPWVSGAGTGLLTA
eukprot:CAMPEP_0179196254 /NCGR_PEP_ID=MMETSP0796-20121207/97578_1 /TAXON_ID=73915 /ORGANISM="Pyrodinium bahamense, Strain pbaha01" /LENGTH=34 /DNA_ID= /DNA_START= /DNA_END= /DNA_ORIENTATION=